MTCSDSYSVILDAMFMAFIVEDAQITPDMRADLENAHNFKDREAVYATARRCLTLWAGNLSDFTHPIQGTITVIYRIPTMIAHTPLEQWE